MAVARDRRGWAWASAVAAALTTVLYVVLILREGNNALWEVFPWAMIMAIGTSLALTSAVVPDQVAGRYSAVAAVVVLGVLGFVSIFSVGMGFILAAALAGYATLGSSEGAQAT